MTPETKLDLAAIKERAAAATPGPWKVALYLYEDDSSLHILRSDGANVAMSSHDGDPLAFLSGDDGEFIAAARTDVPALVAEVERLREEMDRATVLFNAGWDACKAGKPHTDEPNDDEENDWLIGFAWSYWNNRHKVESRAETAEAEVVRLRERIAELEDGLNSAYHGLEDSEDRANLRALLAKGGAA